jgi:branched-chain amino acid transport system permease protein
MSAFTQKLKNIKWKRYVNYIAVSFALILFSTLSLTGSLKQSTLYLLEKMGIAILLSVSLGLVVGFLGELSLGHAGFMCIGAYMGGKTSVLLASAGMGDGVVNLIISVVVGALSAAALGFVVGLPALRLKGDYLAIVTLAFCEIVKTVFENSSTESFGGPMGLRTPRMDKDYLFIIIFVFILICLAVMQNFIRSKHGRAITAIRDNEIAARATGINVTKYKLTAFIISAAFAGIAGVMYSFANSTVAASAFDYNYSIEILVMVVLGGMGNITGGMISAAVITFLNVKLTTMLTGDNAVLKDLIYALILVLIVIYNNAPALKFVRERYNLKALMAKVFKKNSDVSRDVDDEGKWDRVPTKIKMDELLSVDVIVRESVIDPDKKERD